MVIVMRHPSISFLLSIVHPVVVIIILCSPLFAESPDNKPLPLEAVRGTGCYTYGDNETPSHAKRAAMTMAQEQAVRNHRVFVQSASKVKNFQLEEDLIQTASAAMLEHTEIEKEEKKAQEICVTITAKISPVSMEELIRQRVTAKEISKEAQSTFTPKTASFGLRLWANKEDGRYVEGEHLIIFLQSTRDGYLKLDYFQADGTVVHMVPNMFRGQELIKAGRNYVFGDQSAPEQFLIGAPFGNETIKAILSERPIPVSADNQSVEDGRVYLNDLKGKRGLRVQATEESMALVTSSKVVEEYKKERAPRPAEKEPSPIH